MNFSFPQPETEPIPVVRAIGQPGSIESRCDYKKGTTSWSKHTFDRPCITIRKTRPDWRIVIGGVTRTFSAQELRLLGSFPQGFRFVSRMGKFWGEIGNAVPPLFMRAIALHIRREILNGKAHKSL